MTRALKLTVIAVLLTGPCWGLSWDGCNERASREAVVDAAGATLVRIEAGAGSLEVRGKEGLSEVRAHGEACARRSAQLAEIELLGTRDGGEVVIRTRLPKNGSCSLDLTVELPSHLRVVLDDTSGELRLENVAGAEISDSSGEMEVFDVAGDLDVKDSSGEIEIKRVTGSIRLSDSSGEIEIDHVSGDVLIEEDGSGDITVTNVGGSLRIARDGSGDIRAERIDGDLVVERDGSGDIDYQQIGGTTSLPH